jgi:hypothetical protein
MGLQEIETSSKMICYHVADPTSWGVPLEMSWTQYIHFGISFESVPMKR